VDNSLTGDIRRFLLRVVPDAAAALRGWRRRAARIADPQYRRQALASIDRKDFHVHGGSILAIFLPPALAQRHIELVAAFETAVDYLDNLCDRTGVQDEADFRSLHEALIDAVRPGTSPRAYFRRRKSDDGGYLTELVTSSQRAFAQLPGFATIAQLVEAVTARYCELQALKHLPPGIREARCRDAFGRVDSAMSWWEGAAACGSTLPTFALAFGAARPCTPDRARELHDAYFPWISGFHILLDYFIDQAEDREHGELNFVACYDGARAARSGLERIGREAVARAGAMAEPAQHVFAVKAMCGFYCTRPRVAQQGLDSDAAAIAQAVGIDLGGAAWRAAKNSALGSLLRLYRQVIRA
jgi:tetraprenyl-beta-curcumene synthase